MLNREKVASPPFSPLSASRRSWMACWPPVITARGGAALLHQPSAPSPRHEMTDNHGFARGQAKLLLCLDEDRVLPRAEPDLVQHQEDALLPVARVNQRRATQEHRAMQRVHEAPQLKLLPVLRIGAEGEE